MILSLRLKNFRRYKDETFTFDSGVNFIEGGNNSGKTTLFYAIEYALFGRVGSFRSQSAFMSPGSSTLGVEVVFKGKSGGKYRLQRIHTRPPRARTKVIGHFTLKQFVGGEEDEGGERYLLSSDFQDHEESLALKINEILGITHKLFNVAGNMRQGEIASILEGAPQLDIVLGVTASVLASEEMRAMALEREKECRNLPMFQETVRRLEAEKQVQTDRKNNLETEAKTLAARIDSLSGVDAWGEQARELIIPMRHVCRDLTDALDALNMINSQYEQTQKQAGELTAEFGALENVKEKRASIRRTEDELTRKKEKAAVRLTGFSNKKSALDNKRGDLSGRISRRLLPLDGMVRCETCGQIIDRELNEREIKAWRLEREKIDEQLRELGKRTARVRSESDKTDALLKAAALEEGELAHAESSLKNLFGMVAKQEKEAGEASEKLFQCVAAGLASAESCAKQCADFAETTRNPEISFDFDRRRFDDSSEKSRGPEAAKSVLESLDAAVADLDDKLKASIVRAQTELRAIRDNQARTEADLKALAGRMAEIDRELAGARTRVETLGRKEFAAKQLRTLAVGFKDLQVRLRENVSAALAENTFGIHKTLSDPDNELKSLEIDPTRYSVHVVPFDIGKKTPAHLYQGGGHKLLLGLAFKMAVAKMVGPCPFILLDEPTYGLDEAHRGKLLERIADVDIARQMLLITHHEIGNVPGRNIRIIREGKASIQDRGGDANE